MANYGFGTYGSGTYGNPEAGRIQIYQQIWIYEKTPKRQQKRKIEVKVKKAAKEIAEQIEVATNKANNGTLTQEALTQLKENLNARLSLIKTEYAKVRAEYAAKQAAFKAQEKAKDALAEQIKVIGKLQKLKKEQRAREESELEDLYLLFSYLMADG